MIGAGSGNNAPNLRVGGTCSIGMIPPSYAWAVSPSPLEMTHLFFAGWHEILAKDSEEGPRKGEITRCHLGMANKTIKSFSRD
jgi:hypothetical protein